MVRSSYTSFGLVSVTLGHILSFGVFSFFRFWSYSLSTGSSHFWPVFWSDLVVSGNFWNYCPFFVVFNHISLSHNFLTISNQMLDTFLCFTFTHLFFNFVVSGQVFRSTSDFIVYDRILCWLVLAMFGQRWSFPKTFYHFHLLLEFLSHISLG